MFSEDILAAKFLPERTEPFIKDPKQKNIISSKQPKTAPKSVYCEFYPKLHCCLPHAIYSVCQRCSRAFLKGIAGYYQPAAVNDKEVYDKIISLAFFFSEKKF